MTKHKKTKQARLDRKDTILRLIIAMANSKHNSEQKMQLDAIKCAAMKALDA